MAISGTGEGLEPALQGLATSMVDKSHTARMFTNVAFLDLTARIIGGPLMTNLLYIKIKESSFRFEGLSFLISAVRSLLLPLFRIGEKWLMIQQLLFAIVVVLASRLTLSR